MFSLIKKFLQAETYVTKQNRRPKAQRRLMRVEGLEARNLMAVGWSITNGDLYISGSNGNDTVVVSKDGSDFVLKDTYAANSKPGVASKGHALVNATTRIAATEITGGDIVFNGFNGNDNFTNSTFLRLWANGGEGNDVLSGGYGADSLQGGIGDDVLRGNGGNDFLDGGFGSDVLYGDAGNDTIQCGPDFAYNQAFGGLGNDTITGGYGIDSLHGDAGDDTLDGSYGQDLLYGGNGKDILRAGNDSEFNYLDGGAGDDKLYGSYGNDEMHGGAGTDSLYGYAGNDTLDGGTGRDSLHGGDGDDSLNGGGDDDVVDRLFGDAGRDTFFWEQYIDDDFGYDYTAPLSECMDFDLNTDINPYSSNAQKPNKSAGSIANRALRS